MDNNSGTINKSKFGQEPWSVPELKCEICSDWCCYLIGEEVVPCTCVDSKNIHENSSSQ